jgi:hypothetical protein
MKMEIWDKVKFYNLNLEWVITWIDRQLTVKYWLNWWWWWTEKEIYKITT